MGVPLCPSTESPTLYMGSQNTIGHHLGSLILYTVLVSHSVQLQDILRDPVCPKDSWTGWDTRTGYCHYVAGHPMRPRTDGNPIPFMYSHWQLDYCFYNNNITMAICLPCARPHYVLITRNNGPACHFILKVLLRKGYCSSGIHYLCLLQWNKSMFGL